MRATEFVQIPFVFEKLEMVRATHSGRVSSKDILDYYSGIDESYNRSSVEARYNDLVHVDGSIFALPKHDRFLATFAIPLKFAKVNYLLGNYQGTIALCGFIGEMCTVFIYDFAHWCSKRKNGRKYDIPIQSFERKGQKSRVEKLTSFGLINEAYAKSFTRLNDIRNEHVHGYRIFSKELQHDAKEAYGLAVRILLVAIGQQITKSPADEWGKGAYVSVEHCHPLIIEFLEAKWKSRPVSQ
ncbi:hypothetical protein KKH27_13670 [bacterium]|nr:hypothetical protein [bacterium]MBU1984511.1 hypothetical protein [bacterium]